MISKVNSNKKSHYDRNCVLCPRLASHLAEVRKKFPDYHARPVPPFGDEKPDLMIVGLAPGMHGANATGRPFTGDYAGILLYKALHKYGYSNLAEVSAADDGLKLKNCRITNAVKCLPPENKPVGAEVNNCNRFLEKEIESLGSRYVILALGGVAHKAVLKALSLKPKGHEFGHANLHLLAQDKWLIDSYHCSRYNTQTRRLSEDMFFSIFDKIDELLAINN
ncbi:MAG: uracil-DNA glycosylase [Gammaproteobacteria bacterium]|nr:uracil-DNA glycosylase [Gammaproteobacteria bacterium]